MTPIRLTHCCLIILVISFGLLAKRIFDAIFLTTKNVIDEEFHLPLGFSYCKFDINVWDNKVTTLPGLYMISALFLGPFDLCSVYWLRFVSFASSIFNILLYNILLNESNGDSRWKNMLAAVNMALIPPIFFFSHFYYTDVVSITIVLLLLHFSKTGNHYLASFFGILSVLMRQTNIIYVGLVFALFLLKEISRNIPNKYQNLDGYEFSYQSIKLFLTKFIDGCILTFKTANLDFWLNCFSYLVVLLTFVLFIVWNGSIVVGDKTAHGATMHVPQLFYFSIFTLIFGWPHYLNEIGNFIKHAWNHKLTILFCILISLAFVHWNTQVHSYLLADNRHYTFYIWNRLYGKYIQFRYLMVPIYIFSLYVIISKLCYSTRIIPALIFVMCTFAVLVPQKLIEIRYFFLPYIYFRLHIKNAPIYHLLLELVTYVVLNAVTLNLFFTKTIKWETFEEEQRLIW